MKITRSVSVILFVSAFGFGAAGAVIDSSSFASRVELPFAGIADMYWPEVAIGDLDGDGKPDIAAIDGPGNKFWVFRNMISSGSINGGSFAAGVPFSLPAITSASGPGGLAIGDLDGDGKRDLVFIEGFGGGLFVVRNISTPGSISASSFEPAILFQGSDRIGLDGDHNIALRDMDGDGKLDIVTSIVAVLRNTSVVGVLNSSSFAPPAYFPMGDIHNNHSLVVDDLDGDNKPDVVSVGRSSGNVFVLRNTSSLGNVSLDLQAQLTVGCCPESLGLGDFNGDGKLDLAVGRFLSSDSVNLILFQNNSTPGNLAPGSFAPPVNLSVGNFFRIGVGDLDGDGKPDLAGANDVSLEGGFHSVLSVLQNVLPTGALITPSAFAPKVSFDHDGGGSVVLEDLDGDDRLDLVLGDFHSRWVAIFQNTIDAGTPPTITCPADILEPTAPGQCVALVAYTPLVTDDSGNVTVTCSPPSGAPFVLGTTTVQCSATNSSGGSTCSFTVTIHDAASPSIICPPNIEIGCNLDMLVPVNFPATAQDNCDPNPTLVCVPASGSTFPVGTTTIHCTAGDSSGNQANCSFTVTRALLDFTGFLDPINGADATGGSFAAPVRSYKKKSPVRLKFTAACGGSPVLTGIHRLHVINYISETTAGEPLEAREKKKSIPHNRFRLMDSRWCFDLDPVRTGMNPGIWLLRATLSEGSQHTAWIQIK